MQDQDMVKSEIDRSVPLWPEMRNDGLMPVGFGYEKGNAPCFCTRHNSYNIYIPHSLVADEVVAYIVFDQIISVINEDIWNHTPNNRFVIVNLDGRKAKFFLQCAFGFILVQNTL